jgi:DNA-binding IclR family transcriptional regulator
MIEMLLRVLAEGGVYSYEALARRLSISQSLLEAVLEDLERLGYLRSLGDGCETRCAACHEGGCSIVGSGRLWALTDKGLAAVDRLSSPSALRA